MADDTQTNQPKREAPVLGNVVDAYREDIVACLQELIRYPSVRGPSRPGSPFGSPVHEALRHLLALGERWGFKTRDVDGYAGYVEFGPEGERPSIDEETVAVLTHLDVVPAGEGWTHPPYAGVLEDGRVYGRGASDNKGPAVVALFALKALRDAGYKPSRPLRVIFGCSEETGMEDMPWFFSREPLPWMAFTPDVGYPAINREKGILHLELSWRCSHAHVEGPVVLSLSGGDAINMVPQRCVAELVVPSPAGEGNGHSGQQEGKTGAPIPMDKGMGHVALQSFDGKTSCLHVETYGKSSHGAVPELGVNAALRMTQWVEALLRRHVDGAKQEAAAADTRSVTHSKSLDELGFLHFLNETVGAGTDGQGFGIACRDEESGALSMNLGILRQNEGLWTACLDIRYPVSVDGDSIVAGIRQMAGAHGVTLKVLRQTPPLFVPADHPLIGRLRRAYEMYTGEEMTLLSTGGGTYARALAGRGIGFGGAGANAHSPDEYVEVEELMRHARTCTQAMVEISS